MEHDGDSEDWSAADWERVAEQRSRFLATAEEEGSGWGSAWRDERDLELYDESFGARIGWKWEAVLGELAARSWFPPGGHVHDFASGTGIAMRAVLRRYGTSFCKRATYWDRSPLAREFTRTALVREHEALDPVEEAPGASGRIDLLLVSHVLGELDEDGWEALRGEIARSRAVILVEPGSKDVSRTLGKFREELAPTFAPVAPCPHQGACGAMAPGAEAHWCHFFARPPQEAFSVRRWTLFARRLGIDLRSLPYAYLLLERRSALHAAPAHELARFLGRARVEKGRAKLFVCEASGLSHGRFLERDDRAFFKSLRAPFEPTLVELAREGERIRSVVPRSTSLERSPETSIVLTPADVTELGEGRALVFDGVLGEARARAIAAELTARAGDLRPAAVGKGSERRVEASVRGDSIAWLERETQGPLADLWRLFDGLRAELAARAWIALDDCEVQLAVYPPGSSYSRHRDAFARDGRRRVSVIYYMNDWLAGDGGELCVHEGTGVRRIAPELDRLVLFLSERVEHEVRETRTVRQAVSAWMLGP